MNRNETSSFQSQKKQQDFELDREELENLASRRTQLKQLLQSCISSNGSGSESDGHWVLSSPSSSFLLMSHDETRHLLEKEIDDVERELRDVCFRLQQIMDGKSETGSR
mmetsp:Transcript_38340/g.46820  ORF Transcript_38340/g.46820 Transcript_38340/m.46820 type:complete len:109 (+) Transcript_38340:68-394(+)|eukprot:CAMPEP_0172498900 /NCGR_PEP_ID=MMETSP1066-20121228/119309_1 /TAXON_ID=671091 /ORGANISM="Coscinodiscus wailesii, Strain CCMP2513" /LENGTH=108 /DNA_ID=CAMNT_0013272373 /DNA_START=57 /DNA_END=383 /DNA_ORIENTATION=+